MSERALLSEIYNSVLTRIDADVGRHRNVVWNACITLIADSLRPADPFTRERLLRSLEREVRDSIERLSLLLDGKDGGVEMTAGAAASRHIEATETASAHTPNASPAPNGGAPQQAKRQRKAVPEEFPVRIRLNITHAMNHSLERMRRRTRLKQAVVARLGLMDYLARHDPEYRED